MEPKEDETIKDFSQNFRTNSYPPLLTEEELINLLRTPEISRPSTDHHNVILNLIRIRDLPRIHISKKLLFPLNAVLEWIDKETIHN